MSSVGDQTSHSDVIKKMKRSTGFSEVPNNPIIPYKPCPLVSPLEGIEISIVTLVTSMIRMTFITLITLITILTLITLITLRPKNLKHPKNTS